VSPLDDAMLPRAAQDRVPLWISVARSSFRSPQARVPLKPPPPILMCRCRILRGHRGNRAGLGFPLSAPHNSGGAAGDFERLVNVIPCCSTSPSRYQATAEGHEAVRAPDEFTAGPRAPSARSAAGANRRKARLTRFHLHAGTAGADLAAERTAGLQPPRELFRPAKFGCWW